ncbi:MAG: 6,7-dimethyl-8-ribityllumazine synthase [Elusimicrobia bacterium]|nr:6,7-dimethyl-8-ribityllumazine synthase [Elusimicrobiota bacterium]
MRLRTSNLELRTNFRTKRKLIGIVVARFNQPITQKLLRSCLKTLKRRGLSEKSITTLWVPGSYEIPWAAQELALKGRQVVICLGAVLQGQTSQNTHIASACAKAIQTVALKTRTPCIFGLITPKTERQAWARTKGKLDRGREAAEVAIEMLKLKSGKAA